MPKGDKHIVNCCGILWRKSGRQIDETSYFEVWRGWGKHLWNSIQKIGGNLQLGTYSLGAYSSRATDLGSREPLIGLGAYCLGAYSLGLPILELGNHSPALEEIYRTSQRKRCLGNRPL